MKTQDTYQICTSWISPLGFKITLNQHYTGADAESNSSDFLPSSLPCLYSKNRESWADVDALKICPGEPLLPGGCAGITASERWRTELGQLRFFTQHESNSADASIDTICIHCPECNLNLLSALGSEIGISAFQLPFPWHTGCCCCTQTG